MNDDEANEVIPAQAFEVADALFDAIAANDLDGLRRIYHPDVEVWHNHDDVAQDLETNLRVLNWMARKLPNREYTDVRRQSTPTGFVEQHILRATSPSGIEVAIPACLVVTIEGDRIRRIDEYLDSAHVEPLLA